MFTNDKPAEIRILRRNIVGINEKVPVPWHRKTKYTYLDNAASTPALAPVVKNLNQYLKWYSGVHRGTGYKSILSTKIYNHCHDIIGNFVGADPGKDCVVMLKNTTEAINKLSYRLKLRPSDIVITTDMEHHSNDLPWRARSTVKYAGINQRGELDLENVRQLLHQNYPRPLKKYPF
jgi:cysteine desulfurase/selenocysteine lyase